MDVTLSSKLQTLTLIPCSTPISSSFSSNLRSIRRDFLGCAHALRQPAGTLRSRRKQSKLVLRVQSPRFLFRASLGSHSSALVVVVAVVTFSAVSVVVFNRYRRKKNDGEVRELRIVHFENSILWILCLTNLIDDKLIDIVSLLSMGKCVQQFIRRAGTLSSAYQKGTSNIKSINQWLPKK